MNAEIFSIGTEILLGEILDSNAKFIAQELANMGIDVFYKTSVGDNEDRLLDCITRSFSRCDIILSTGGLGPTDDDLTKETFAKYFKKDLVENDLALENLRDYFVDPDSMPKSNLKQIYLPEGAEVIYNHYGTACGMIVEGQDESNNTKIAIIMPGPPKELIPMFNKYVKPYLEAKTNKVFVSKSLNLIGIGESGASETIKDLMLESKNPTIAPYAGNYEMRFRVTASASNKDKAEELLKPTVKKLYDIFPEFIYGEDDDTLEGVVVNALHEKNIIISTAESCTGGLLASTFVDVEGVSKVFSNGVITYSNESKVKELGVKEITLEEYGAVSKEIAMEMAEGILKKSGSKMGVALTGIAGPSGGTEEKPVGLVYLGIAQENKDTQYFEFMFKGTRKTIRERAVKATLTKLLNILK
ncbi:MAG: competence/damage-inducible protein A [bacterium]